MVFTLPSPITTSISVFEPFKFAMFIRVSPPSTELVVADPELFIVTLTPLSFV